MNKLIKNYAYNLIFQATMVLSPIILTPYITRVFSVDSIGKYNYSFAVVSIFMVMGQLGTNFFGQREIGSWQDEQNERSTIFWNIIFLRIILAIIIIPIYIASSYFQKEYTDILNIMIIYIISNIFDISWFYQGLEDFRKIAIRNFIVKFIGIFSVLSLVNVEDDLILYTLILAVCQLLGNLYLFIDLRNYINRFSYSEINVKRIIRPVLSLFIPTASMYIYTFLDKILIGILSDDLNVAYYTQAEKIIKMIMTIVTSLGVVLLPHLSYELKKGSIISLKNKINLLFSFVIFIGAPLVTGCVGIADIFIPYFLGDSFFESVHIFKILSPLIIIIGFASVLGQSFLIPLKMEKIYSISIFSGAICNLILNVVLIPFWGAEGASYATVFSEFTVTFIQLFYVLKYLGENFIKHIYNNKIFIFGAILVLFVCRIVSVLAISDFFKIVLSIAVSAILYMIVILFSDHHLKTLVFKFKSKQ